MIKRLYLNALDLLYRHYATDRVLNLFLYDEDVEALKEKRYRTIDEPDQEAYDLVLDWASRVVGVDCFKEMSDGYGVYCYDLPFRTPRKLPTKNVIVSSDLGRARMELEPKYHETDSYSLELCRIAKSTHHDLFPNYILDSDFIDKKLRQFSRSVPKVFPHEVQRLFGWGIKPRKTVLSVSCPIFFNEKESAVIASTFIKKLSQFGLEDYPFMLLKGTFAWQAYFVAESDGDLDDRWENQYGTEVFRFRRIGTEEIIPISGNNSSGLQIAWTCLPFEHLDGSLISFDDIKGIVRRTVKALGLATKGDNNKQFNKTSLRYASYIKANWMEELIKEFPNTNKQTRSNVYSNPFPILWSGTWRELASKNQIAIDP